MGARGAENLPRSLIARIFNRDALAAVEQDSCNQVQACCEPLTMMTSEGSQTTARERRR